MDIRNWKRKKVLHHIDDAIETLKLWYKNCANLIIQQKLFSNSRKPSNFVILVFSNRCLRHILRFADVCRGIFFSFSISITAALIAIENREPIFLRTLLKLIFSFESGTEPSCDDKYLDFIAPLCLVIFGSSRTSHNPQTHSLARRKLTNFSLRCSTRVRVERSVLLIKQHEKSSSLNLKPLLVLSTYTSRSLIWVTHHRRRSCAVWWERNRDSQRKEDLLAWKSLNIQHYEICTLSWRQNTWRIGRRLVFLSIFFEFFKFTNNFFAFSCVTEFWKFEKKKRTKIWR